MPLYRMLVAEEIQREPHPAGREVWMSAREGRALAAAGKAVEVKEPKRAPAEAAEVFPAPAEIAAAVAEDEAAQAKAAKVEASAHGPRRKK